MIAAFALWCLTLITDTPAPYLETASLAAPEANQAAAADEKFVYHYLVDSAEHDRHYIERLRPYHPHGWIG